MADFEQRLRELEETLTDTESALHHQQASMPNDDDDDGAKKTVRFSYLYIIGVVIPLLTAAALYFLKPKMVTKKVKGKQVICMAALLKWTLLISAVGWLVLYLLKYSGVIKA